MRKNGLCSVMLLFALCLLVSCTPSPSGVQDEVDYPSYGIDTSLYDEAAANRYNSRNGEFCSIPGMVLFANEGKATAFWRLYYYNKATDSADLFCFDPLCQHTSCVARLFADPSDIVYCAFDGQLYGTPVSSGVRDGQPFGNDNLYRIDLDTMEITRVFEGDGNELLDIFTLDEYIFFRRVGEGGRRELFRYDVATEKYELLPAPEDRQFGAVIISGDAIYVNFSNELELYRTNKDFSSFRNTGLLKHSSVVDTQMYWQEPAHGDDGSTTFYEGNLQTGAVREVGTYPYNFEYQGFDENYLYVCIYGYETGVATARSSVLHRIDIKTGELERMLDCSADGSILSVHVDDGRVFLHQRRAQAGANADHTFWYLTQNDKGEWEKHSVFGKQGE